MMNRFKRQRTITATAEAATLPLQRTPQRISVTISWELYHRLLDRSDQQGRSLSNLAAHLLEVACPA